MTRDTAPTRNTTLALLEKAAFARLDDPAPGDLPDVEDDPAAEDDTDDETTTL
ncbi:hypothetical protein [Amycolatopsis sp. NPDC051903]|uniref:hypothetical protein n=1 Tax=Amycolatopsis sp. NPDC051903 TaxID=3363936 RepID=UPI0037AE687A